jgi:hypothetical protein
VTFLLLDYYYDQLNMHDKESPKLNLNVNDYYDANCASSAASIHLKIKMIHLK